MANFIQQVVDGLASGAIYAALALALVLIFRSTSLVNFAQGEMAMFSTFIAWALTQRGVPIWVAIAITLVLSFVGGLVIQQVAIRPVQGASPLTVVIVTLGLFVGFNALAGFIWEYTIKEFPSPFPEGGFAAGGVRFSWEAIGTLAVLMVVVAALYVLFQRTKVGLAMRAAASNAESSRLVGIKVTQMLLLGWGLAALLGALAGSLVANRLFLEPNMMLGVQIYAFAAATLGGFDSPVGAVVGGLIVGVTENLAGAYIKFIGADLKIVVALVLIFGVLLVKPSGLFGKRVVVRV